MEIVESIINQGHGYLAPTHLVIHETANPGATALNHVSYWRNNPDVPMAHYVTDWTGKVYHCVRDDRVCWHVGNANGWTIGIELCNTAKGVQFDRVWETAVEFAADYLTRRGWGIERMVSHSYCSHTWGGSDHEDPLSYFRQHGRTWNEFKAAVAAEMGGDMPSASEVARAVWSEQINGHSAGERLYLCNLKDYESKDASGRGKDCDDHTRLCYMAAKQEDMQASIDALAKKIDALAAKIK